MDPILEIRGVSKSFGGVEAVQSVSLDVPRGGLLGLIGPNGAGKTTLVNLISKHETLDSGTMLLDSQPIHPLPPYLVARAGLGRTYQQNRLFWEDTVSENIRTAMIWTRVEQREVDGLSYPGLRGSHEQRTADLLDFVGLTEHRDSLPGDLSHILSRRAEFAQALAMAPKMLLLDEPFAGLTVEESRELIELLKRCQRGGLTMLLIDHNMRVVMEVCESLYVMHHGALIAEGTPEEIQSNERVVSVYLAGEL